MADMATPLTSEELHLEHSKLRDDIETIRRYGASHPDEWTELLFENEPSVHIVALFACADPKRHELALRELVKYPDQLEVRRTEFSLSKLEVMMEEVRQFVKSSEPNSFLFSGIGRGRINIGLAADQERLAAILAARCGEAVVLRVGALPFPNISEVFPASEERSANLRPEVPFINKDELEVTVKGELIVNSGRSSYGSLEFENHGSKEVVLATNGCVTARIVDPTSGDIVGGFVGAQTLPLVRFSIPPDGTVTVPLLVGTASFKADLGYAVPPGEWMIDAIVNIEDMGVLRIPPLPVVIAERSD